MSVAKIGKLMVEGTEKLTEVVVREISYTERKSYYDYIVEEVYCDYDSYVTPGNRVVVEAIMVAVIFKEEK